MIKNKDFSKLVSGNWLSNSVIDAIIESFMDTNIRQKYINVLCIDSRDFLRGVIRENHITLKLAFSNRTLVMPVNMSGNHWCLVLADFEKKSYQFYDPLNLQRNSCLYKSEFLRFIKNRNQSSAEKLDTDGWTNPALENVPHQEDTDVDNCGIYVVYYALRFMAAFQKQNFARNLPGKFLLRGFSSSVRTCDIYVCGVGMMNTRYNRVPN
jgi:Ulp1 family protease